MANLLEYTLSLNDQMSANLQKIAVNSDKTLSIFADLEQKSKRVRTLFKDTGASVGSLREKLNLLRNERDWIPQREVKSIRKYNTEIKNLEKQINKFETINGSRTKRWFKEAFQQIPFAGLLTNPLVIAGSVGAKALQLGIEQEMQETSFKVLLGGEEAAKKMMNDISEYAKKTPFKKMGLGDAAKTMLGFGIAQEKVLPTLKTIGDISMGDAEKMKSLTLAYSQMSSTGKLTGQDLLQMINAGFNPLNEISKKTGKSIGELKEEMSKGKISSKMVEDAFKSATGEGGKFNGMAEKMSQTIGGRWSTMVDIINEKLLSLFEFVQPVISAFMDLAIYGLEATSKGINYLSNQIKQGNPYLLMLLGVIGSISGALLIMKIATMAQTAWSAAMTLATNIQTGSWWALNAAMLANPITWVIAGVIALAALIGFLVYKIDGWGEAWDNTVKGVRSLWNSYMSWMKLGWMGVEHLLLSGIEKILIAWYKLKGLWDKDSAQKALDKINSQSEKRKAALNNQGKEVVKKGAEAIQYFSKATGSLKVNDNSLAGAKSEIQKKLGISEPKAPGTNKEITTGLNGDSTKSTRRKNTAVATGGTKHNYITLHINKEMIGQVMIQGKNFRESAKQMEEQLTDGLLRTLALATTAGN